MYAIKLGFGPAIPLVNGEATDYFLVSVTWSEMICFNEHPRVVKMATDYTESAHVGLIFDISCFSRARFEFEAAEALPPVPPMVRQALWDWTEANLERQSTRPQYFRQIIGDS